VVVEVFAAVPTPLVVAVDAGHVWAALILFYLHLALGTKLGSRVMKPDIKLFVRRRWTLFRPVPFRLTIGAVDESTCVTSQFFL
jgi:hypothetical protein